MPRLCLVVSVLLAACAPQEAVLTSGSYVAFLPEDTSLSLEKQAIDPDDPGWPVSYTVDCRVFEDEADRRIHQLDDPIDACADPDDPEDAWPLHEGWLDRSGFRVVGEDLDPWRGEAILNAEGDLQITFHHRVLGDRGADMRLIMSVKPEFQPTTCASREGGGVDIEPMDGDWVERWSEELSRLGALDEAHAGAYAHLEPYLDGGRLFLLNATGYQINPYTGDEFWHIPPQWEAGTTQGKISEDLLRQRYPHWALPEIYGAIPEPDDDSTQVRVPTEDVFFCPLVEGEDPLQSACMASLEERVVGVADAISDDLTRAWMPDADAEPVFAYRPIPHLNRWRIPDGSPAGFDGWGGLHYSYVVFSADSDLRIGGSARGAFGLVLDGLDTGTVVFARGTFEVAQIKKDRWATEDLQDLKAEENDVELCFQQ